MLIEKSLAECRRFWYIIDSYAGIAQLVERNLAKVEVAGPSPVSRSKPILLDYSPLPQYFSSSGVFALMMRR
jgi:hypothetical protein